MKNFLKSAIFFTLISIFLTWGTTAINAAEPIISKAYPVKNEFDSLAEAMQATKCTVGKTIAPQNLEVEKGPFKVEQDFVLFTPENEYQDSEIYKLMDKFNLRPATLHELCAFGATYPSVQLKNVVTCARYHYRKGYETRPKFIELTTPKHEKTKRMLMITYNPPHPSKTNTTRSFYTYLYPHLTRSFLCVQVKK